MTAKMRILWALSCALCLAVGGGAFSLSVDRQGFVSSLVSSSGSLLLSSRRKDAVMSGSASADEDTVGNTEVVVYHPLSISVDGVTVQVACWHPGDKVGQVSGRTSPALYDYNIALSKIGKSLAGWNLPKFIDRSFELEPTRRGVIANKDQQLPSRCPVVLLAHGFLGSRFDLSNIGEELAAEGFLVLSPEFPESLSASYDPNASISGVPIDRSAINDQLLESVCGPLSPTSLGIVGHSLGCGTVDRTGDESWTRVSIAGGSPSVRGPKSCFIGSVNDGAVSVARAIEPLNQYSFAQLDEATVRSKSWQKLSPRTSFIFRDLNNGPNHISFLAEPCNDAMISFLSPLLPVAQLLGIPVLDFDRYQVSRDSAATGEVVIPLVVDYLKQNML